MPKFTVLITASVVTSRTSSTSTKIIDAKDINEAWEKARNDPEVVWGYRVIVSVNEIKSS